MEEIKPLHQKMNAIRDSRFFDDLYHKYTNAVQLNGYLLSKPSYVQFPNGKEFISFSIVHLHRGTFTFFPVQCFSKSVIDRLMGLKKCCLVNLLGIVINKNGKYSIQIEECNVSHEFSELDLEPPYERQPK